MKDNFNRVLKIYPHLWDKEKQRPIKKIPADFKTDSEMISAINRMINRGIASYSEILEFARINNIQLNNQFLKFELEKRLGFEVKEKAEEKIKIIDFIKL